MLSGMGQTRIGQRTVTITGLGLALVVGLVVGPSGAAGGTTPSPGAVDLSVEVVAGPNLVASGSNITFEALIGNRGTLVAEEVKATFEIPVAGVTVESSNCAAVGSVRLERHESALSQPWTVICDLGTMNPEAELRVTLWATAGSPGTHSSVLTVSSRDDEARPYDNRAEISFLVLPSEPEFSHAFQRPGRSNPLSRTVT